MLAVIPVTAALAESDVGSVLSNETSRLRIQGVIIKDTTVSARPSDKSDSVGKVRPGVAVVVTRVEREEDSKNVWYYFSTVPVDSNKADVLGVTTVQIEGWTLSRNVSLKTSVVLEQLDDPEEDDQRVLGSRSIPARGEGDPYEVEATITEMEYREDDMLWGNIYVPAYEFEGVQYEALEGWYNENGNKSSKIVIAIFKIISSWFS